MPSVLPRSVVPTPICQLPGLERGHLLRNLPHRREDQPPGQLGRGVRRRAGVLVRRHDDAEPRAGVDVDVRIDAALADQPQLRQALEQRRADLRALADQHQRLGVAQALGERVDVLDVIVPDRDVVAVELPEAGQRPQRVEVVVENRDLHRAAPSFQARLRYQTAPGRGRGHPRRPPTYMDAPSLPSSQFVTASRVEIAAIHPDFREAIASVPDGIC